ncbi:MAG TPA: DinB family protein [Terracidiphilus sp.]|jgi:uncharacterized damage-inducible protein DinB|nr:DinB family protein [Terracidiphilus sp.]
MKLAETYDYLVRARRDLWSTLESAPDDVLSQDLIGGPRFRSIKDLLFHIAEVEDGWINGDIRHRQFVQDNVPALRQGGPDFSGFALSALLDYWRLVEQRSIPYIAGLTEVECSSSVEVEDSPETHFTVDRILWHVMIHEMRHTSQIAMLLRTQGIKPPALDLLFYLPSR